MSVKNFKGEAAIDSSALKAYLQKRKQAVAAAAPLAVNKAKTMLNLISPAWKLSKENLIALEKFMEQLKLKAYSPSTLRTYRNEFIQLLQLIKKKPVNELTTDELRRYFVYCFEKLQRQKTHCTAGSMQSSFTLNRY